MLCEIILFGYLFAPGVSGEMLMDVKWKMQMHAWGHNGLGVGCWEMGETEVISRGQVSGVRGRGGHYFLFRNPAEVACLREARSWRFIIKRQNLNTVWTKQNT